MKLTETTKKRQRHSDCNTSLRQAYKFGKLESFTWLKIYKLCIICIVKVFNIMSAYDVPKREHVRRKEQKTQINPWDTPTCTLEIGFLKH